ncbi:MAG TPA: hypothetical protein VF088_07780 [Pyrinomonadaceae bacterium]
MNELAIWLAIVASVFSIVASGFKILEAAKGDTLLKGLTSLIKIFKRLDRTL